MPGTERTIISEMPESSRSGRVCFYELSWSDDLLVCMALATDRASREAQGYTRAGFEFVERLVEIPGRNPVKNYALTTYWDPPNAPLNTLNPRNLNNAEQYVLGQLVEGADADRLAVGSKENRF